MTYATVFNLIGTRKIKHAPLKQKKKKETAHPPQEWKDSLYNNEFLFQRHTHFLKVLKSSHSSQTLNHGFYVHQLSQHRRPPVRC